MTTAEFNSTFSDNLDKLSNERKIEFAINICKELFFDYQIFAELHQWGNPDLLMDTIKLCSVFKTKQIDSVEINRAITRLEEITPDMDDFSDVHASCALNACTAVSDTLLFLRDKNQKHMRNVGAYFMDTTYAKIDENLNLTQMDLHPLIINARAVLISRLKVLKT